MAKSKAASISNIHKEYVLETILDELAQVPDPDLILEEKGISRHRLCRLLNDDELFSLVETRRGKAIGVPWKLDRSGDNEDWIKEQIAEHVIPVLTSAWNANLYGYSVQNLKLVKTEGRSIIDFVTDVPIEYFYINNRGELIVSANGKHEVVDTDFQFILTRKNPSYRNPYGEALLSRAYWIWFFRHNGWRFYMNFLERFSDPLISGSVTDPAAFKDAMAAAGFASVIALNMDESAEAVTQTGSSDFPQFEQIITKRYQKLIMGQSGTSEVGKNGSRAAIEVMKGESDDSRLAPDINLMQPAGQHLVNALWIANKFPGDAPKFIIEKEKGLQAERAERDKTLVDMGVRFTPDYYAQAYGLDEDEFEVTDPDTTPSATDTSSTDPQLSAPRSIQLSKSSEAQKQVDELGDQTIDQLNTSDQALVDIILSAEDKADMEKKLITFALTNQVDTGAIDRALSIADVIGYTSQAQGVATDD